jgi:hypothetical protein
MALRKIAVILLLSGCSSQSLREKLKEEEPIHEVVPIPNAPIIAEDAIKSVLGIVDKSPCKTFWFNDWDGEKQRAPTGYLQGLALSFHQAQCKSGGQMADRWAQLISHGLWESGGKFCEGADLSSGRPNSITSVSAEAGFAQTSYDATGQVQGLAQFIESWQGDCLTDHFSKGFTCTDRNLKNYGDPNSLGYKFQQRAKSCGSFAAEVMLKTWDIRKNHYYTFKQSIVQTVPVCVDMFNKIKEIPCAAK